MVAANPRLEEALAQVAALTPSEFSRFSAHLDPAWIDEALLATGTATLRRRRLPAEMVVWLVVGMALLRDRPIVDVVRHLELVLPGAGGSRTVAPSAIAQARGRLGPEPLEWLFARSGAEWGHASADRHRWRGLALYGVDGSTLRVPDSDVNRIHFGDRDAGSGRGVSGYPLLRLVVLMALRSHVLVAANFGPFPVDERNYADALWSSIPSHSLTIADRLYLKASFLVGLRREDPSRHWLIRAKSATRMTKVKKLGRSDFIVELPVSSQSRAEDPSLPRTFHARAIRYHRAGFRPQILLTSLVDDTQYPADELVVLYHERWELELGLREVKSEILQREETIRSKTPSAVHQELFGILLAYNLVRLEMERIADDIDEEPTRISFVAALRFVIEEWQWSMITSSPGAIPRHLSDMRDKIRRFLLPPRRPARSFPRAVKLTVSNYPRKRPIARPKRPK